MATLCTDCNGQPSDALRGLVESDMPEAADCCYEIVIDALCEDRIRDATGRGIRAACGEGIVQISAGNYGGKLGPFHFHLHEILAGRD